MSEQGLVAAFRAAHAARGLPEPQWPELAEVLERLWSQARHEWPMLAATPDSFSEALAARVEDPAGLERVCGADLYLVLGCLAGDVEALRGLDAVLTGLRPAVARAGASAAQIDDVLATIRARLLVGSAAGEAKLALYRGEARLAAWLRVILLREYRAQNQREARHAGVDSELHALLDRDADPELEELRRRFRAPFRDAFAAALESLTPKQRTVLRHHLLDQLSIDRIAALHRVHRSTAARWLVAIREHLFEQTRTHLMQSLGLSTGEFASVLALVRSRLTYSIAGFLDTQ
ncbi:MAG: sigma factor-like helix-turn-helix DNA-binding protein [Myxococcota bacterium]